MGTTRNVGAIPGIVLGVLLGVLADPLAAAGAELALEIDPDRTSLAFVLDATMHTVRGTLGTPRGRIAFDPASGVADGEVVIDLRGAGSGNDRRDRKMHEKILETVSFPTSTYRVTRIDLPRPLRQGRNELQLHGQLRFHGVERSVAVPAIAVLEGDRVTATAWIEVPYVAWGLDDPSFFVLRVGKAVRVEIEAAGRVEGTLPDSALGPPP
jgi:polyisoprenoid-binding protein YceI